MNTGPKPTEIIDGYRQSLQLFGESFNGKVKALQELLSEQSNNEIIQEAEDTPIGFLEANQIIKQSQQRLVNNYQDFDMDNESLVNSIKRLLYVTEELIERSNEFMQDWSNINMKIGIGRKKLDTHIDLIRASLNKVEEELFYIDKAHTD